MSLSTRIADEIKSAMKARDKKRLEALRSIKSAVMLAETEKPKGTPLSDEDELKVLQRLQKQRKDALEIYNQQNRADLAEDEQAQLEVIESFLPRQMSADELRQYLTELIARVGASSPKDMGKVMGTASKELSGKADGKTISGVVRELLA